MTKRSMPIWAGVLCALCLAACGAAPAAISGASGGSSAGSSMPAPPEKFQYTVTQETQKNSASAEDGTLLAQCSYQLPVLRAYRGDGTEIAQAQTPAEKKALEKASAFNAKFADWAASADFDEMAEWAREDYAQSRTPNGVPWNDTCYDAELTASVWQTEQLVSVSAVYYTYTGGAHPNRALLAWNFDLNAGTFLDPTALGDEQETFRAAVAAELVRQAKERAAQAGTEPETLYWPEYQDLLGKWSDTAVSFNDAGMTVSYSPYDLACYAAGEQVFTLDWDFLTPYLSDYGRQLLNRPA